MVDETEKGPGGREDARGRYLTVDVKDGDESGIFTGMARNLSQSGMFMATVAPAKEGTEFRITFKLPFEETVVNCICKVMWSSGFETRSTKGTGVGVRFVDLDDETRDRIAAWAGEVHHP